ncbi:MAG TPA: protein-disulfide reductase DsbD domain-containing protein [Puia sp.]|nr:protein-disulfide reductase DsbD domain-containing protein [Puia sp.]
MKKIVLFALVISSVNLITAQSSKQVNWTYTAKKIAENTYEVHMTASINGDYHLYAQDAGGDGPIPTAFTFSKNPVLQLNGKVKEVGNLVKKFDKTWNHDLKYYEKNVDFVQVVKLKANIKTDLIGKVEFMVCNDRQCLPPADVEIKVNVGS